MRLTLKQLKIEAAKLGATVDDSTLRAGFVNIDAPTGMVWSCSGDIHSLCVNLHHAGNKYGDEPDATFRQEAIADAMDRMAAGVESCTIENCDICEENLASLDTVPKL